jgi:methylglutaconyl-CoA hydratase
MTSSVLYSANEAIATLTLNRPEKRNALDNETIAELGKGVARADQDNAIKVIVLRGAGKDFCAGADLSQLERIAAGGSREENYEDAMKLGDLLIQMRKCTKPLIAAVQGNALAGGAGLASACDLIIADENAVFGYPEVRLGFVPAMVMALLIRITGEKYAFELAALGNSINAAEAQRIGLVTRIAKDFDNDVGVYARELASRSASAVQLIKGLRNQIDGAAFDEAIRHGAEVNVLARETEDCRTGVRRFLDQKKKS